MKLSKETIKKDFVKKLITMFSEDIDEASTHHKYLAFGSLIKDYCAENWMKTNKRYIKEGEKQVYYFSMEFLIGRLLKSNLLNLGIGEESEKALAELGINIKELEEAELDAGLGNGGLGRLAACFLDSMASLGIAGHGCGIRYKYGLFEQKIVNGYQVEIPDNWLKEGNIWETRKDNKSVIVKFGGIITPEMLNGRLNFKHENYQAVRAVPYDTPVIGYENDTVNNLRLWSAETVEQDKDLDFSFFKYGNYSKAVEYKSSIESISQVLYPDDSQYEGKILRLKQQYFFVSAGIQSIIRNYKKRNKPINELDKYIAIHVNDTHPSLAVPELMRILIDEEELDWDEAWDITTKTISYTNHTIMAEALEKWDITMFKELLPRIYMIVEEINRRFEEDIKSKYGDNEYKIGKMAILYQGKVRMANLAIVGGHSVNGVAKLHTEILKKRELSDFYELYPDKFNNKTNGITHRRWLIQSNPELAKFITEAIGDEWIKNPKKLTYLLKYVNKKKFQERLYNIKRNNKAKFANEIKRKYNIDINPNSIFDVQVKRLHAYKRQMLNLFHIIYLYNKLKENPNLDIVPRTFIFGAKASPSYYLAKEVIKLINTVGDKINNDKDIQDKIKVVFLENYRVSLAEKIIPCADVSEQISTASKEASGTGNMKFMMNGAITLATLDGANIEIREAVGDNNIITFGLNADEVMNYEKNGGYNSREIYNQDARIHKIMDQITNGYFGVPSSEFKNIYRHLMEQNDEYFVFKDFDSYVKAQEKIDTLYRNRSSWMEISGINIAKSGIFSSDNTIDKYSKEIWNSNN
ncbi:glycogen/starch/alpha-glucan phosphorylase [Clostridium massiliodielmoense]|uniref:glycogen/starch/alpha-glucan phosphorylase n=1 Tax=Clostridium massiliodielmoense TaxID=1776385 RepID=UPI000166A2AE|nr:glycogen/starch/alpha-glucan phosphorylase [Clostridium massiliodielmoense]EDS78585.1 glycogen phosphorylase [Clostridium botulinum C str. Eklund]KEH95318.1 maltodextrin phosphorylase [Clostridium botulinum C/D str. BKT12695]NEZ49731.1 glycogen/starch/alpha-glucan phosphorylase [Clostridium botulinum]